MLFRNIRDGFPFFPVCDAEQGINNFSREQVIVEPLPCHVPTENRRNFGGGFRFKRGKVHFHFPYFVPINHLTQHRP